MLKEVLENYVNKGYSTHKISKEEHISQTTTRYWLKKYDLSTIYCKKNKVKKQLLCLYCSNLFEYNTPSSVRNKKKLFCSEKCRVLFSRKKKVESGCNVTNQLLSKYLKDERGLMCEQCKNTEWQNSPIPLEVEHIDGNSENNNIDNLKLLCPNCHALTNTYKGKNRGNGRYLRRIRYNSGKSY